MGLCKARKWGKITIIDIANEIQKDSSNNTLIKNWMDEKHWLFMLMNYN